MLQSRHTFDTWCLRKTPLALAMMVAAAPSLVLAQDSLFLEEVTVTAQKRAETVQELPISVTAFSGDTMKALGFTTSTQLAAQTPGLQTGSVNGEGNIPVISIRGVGMLDFAEHNESPSAIYVDEFYKANLSGLDFALFDLERAEVLRGPQGTLFGRNATGGLVHYITAKPTQDAEGYVDVTAAEYGKIAVEGAISGGLTDTVAGRLSLTRVQTDGYYKQLNPALEDGNQTDLLAVRGQLAFEPSEDLSMLLSVTSGNNKNDGGNPYHALSTTFDSDGLSIPAPGVVDPTDKREVNTDVPLSLETSVTTSTFRIEYDLSDSVQLVSLTGYEHMQKDFVNDVDALPYPIFKTVYDAEGKEFTQELRLSGDNETSRWVTGLFYMDYQNQGVQNGKMGAFVPAYGAFGGATDADGYQPLYDTTWDMHTKSWAVFGQYEQDFTERLTGVLGARYGSEDKEFDALWEIGEVDAWATEFNPSTVGDLAKFDKSNLSYNARLNFQVNDDLLTYVGTSRAYKAGTFNMGFEALPTEQIPVDQEELTSYELGFKSTMSDGKVRLNGAAFYYQYNDHQAFYFTGASSVLFNNDAEIKGAELELQASPWDGWDFVLGASLLDTTLLDLADPGGTVKDREMSMAPEFSGNALVRYSFSAFGGTMALQADGTYNGQQFFDAYNSPSLKEGAYAMGNVRASWMSADDHWTVTAFVENVTDAEYRNYAFDLTGLLGVNQEVWSKPRWAGLTVGYKM